MIRLTRAALGAGVDAAADLLEALEVPVEKVIDPTTRSGFLRVVARLRDALRHASAEGEAEALRAALRTLDVDWAALDVAGREAVFQATRQAIAGGVIPRVMPGITQQFGVVGSTTAAAARAGVVRRFDLSIATRLLARDLVAERFVRTSTANFVRDEYGRRADELASLSREVVARGLADGVGRDAIAGRLSEALGNRVTRSDGYWQVVANQFVGQARTFSVLGAFEEAGIEAYRFEAVLDEVTTDQCRFYDGQVFSTGAAVGLRDRIANLENPDDVYEMNPWVRAGRDEAGNRILYVDRGSGREVIATVDRSGVGARDDRGSFSNARSSAELQDGGIPWPPLHANCRSEIVPASG